ncbi:hypothetical protein FPY71_05410 [Aureimonas fodinaquatilis]|uniref:Uncharacterized protein n=1 Tax=Aureimonas fodinaquatilis TaxID=2565783 RepID=A0A5B0E2H5_9HYPH|nr:hypothetical protein [Aureimonas fodinaquatilis]KAA0972522.1 hypothetical protein FPY71_05410 [Aureimonas fodinaquatilis]
MSDNDSNPVTTDQVLGNIKAAISDYNIIKNEIEKIELLVQTLFSDFVDKSPELPTFDFDEKTRAIFSQAGQAASLLKAEGEELAALIPAAKTQINQVGWDGSKVYDDLYNGIWRNTRMIKTPDKVQLAFEKQALIEWYMGSRCWRLISRETLSQPSIA